MQVKQIADLINEITSEELGVENPVKEDLGNIVEIGDTIANVMGVDNWVRKLNDKIGKMVFVNRVYAGRAPSVLMDGWEYGSILEKVSAELPEAQENESWQLDDGVSVDPNIFYKAKVSAKCYNKRVTFEIPMSFTEIQVKSAFNSAEQMNAFVSMIYTTISNSMTVKLDALVMRTINNFIAETVYNDYGANSISGSSGTRAINLLYLYNNGPNYGQTALSAAAALTDADFLRFAAKTIKLTAGHMKVMSKLFNIEGKERFTPSDRMKVVMLDEFISATEIYLYGNKDEFKAAEYAKLPDADVVPYWQGSGTDYAFDKTGKIYCTTASGHDVTVTGVLAVVFDRDALGVTNMNPRVTTNYNPKGEFFNEWHKVDAGYFNALDEQGVVFFVA